MRIIFDHVVEAAIVFPFREDVLEFCELPLALTMPAISMYVCKSCGVFRAKTILLAHATILSHPPTCMIFAHALCIQTGQTAEGSAL